MGKKCVYVRHGIWLEALSQKPPIFFKNNN